VRGIQKVNEAFLGSGGARGEEWGGSIPPHPTWGRGPGRIAAAENGFIVI